MALFEVHEHGRLRHAHRRGAEAKEAARFARGAEAAAHDAEQAALGRVELQACRRARARRRRSGRPSWRATKQLSPLTCTCSSPSPAASRVTRRRAPAWSRSTSSSVSTTRTTRPPATKVSGERSMASSGKGMVSWVRRRRRGLPGVRPARWSAARRRARATYRRRPGSARGSARQAALITVAMASGSTERRERLRQRGLEVAVGRRCASAPRRQQRAAVEHEGGQQAEREDVGGQLTVPRAAARARSSRASRAGCARPWR